MHSSSIRDAVQLVLTAKHQVNEVLLVPVVKGVLLVLIDSSCQNEFIRPRPT